MNAIKQQQAAPTSINGFGSGGNVMQGGDDPLPIDLHSVYLRTKAAGYTYDLTLSACAVQGITGRMRGVEAIAALLLATSNEDNFKTSEYMRAGLVEALYHLTSDAHSVLERGNEHAEKMARGVAA